MNKFKILLLVFPFLISAACIHDDVAVDDDIVVFFQFEYVNHAWGFQHNGFIIDQQGNVYDYEKPDDWVWPENNEISTSAFESNLSKAEGRLAQLDGSDIKEMTKLAKQARYGDLTEQKSVMADAGAEVYAIYTATVGDNILTRHLLQQRGDVYQKNKTSASDEITEWLIDFRGTDGFPDDNF
jgi:hypothetical protein